MIKAGVVGWPIAHSRSPLIHGHWLAVHGIDGRYDKLAIPPQDLATFLDGLADNGLSGLNVTVPHKEAAALHVRELDAVAARLGAANTLWLDDGRLFGANTDVHGFVASLDDAAPGWDANPRLAVTVGAGGAARAVIHGLVERGFDVAVTNRTVERAEAIAARYDRAVTAHPLEDFGRLSADAAVIVNTTSAGLDGSDALAVGMDGIGAESIVADIVYVPLETPFLAAARRRGLRTVDGLGMLLHQAAPGFERWFGVRPTVTQELRRLVEADIDAAGKASSGAGTAP
jgi:shikimate dehydrogenase